VITLGACTRPRRLPRIPATKVNVCRQVCGQKAPFFGTATEILPVFSRKPLFGYKDRGRGEAIGCVAYLWNKVPLILAHGRPVGFSRKWPRLLAASDGAQRVPEARRAWGSRVARQLAGRRAKVWCLSE
jgi:hypothetical protein